MARSRSRKGQPARAKAPAAREPLRVLVVDDSPTDAELCLHELRAAGFDVTSDIVSMREELVARLRDGRYDVVLSDYRMPGWTGMDALDVVRERGGDTPLILVTGSLGDEAAAECVRRGAADYVIKKHLSRLPVAVHQAVVQRRLRDSHAAAMAALQESEERFRSVYENTAIGLYRTTPDGRIVMANPALVKMLGYATFEDLARRNLEQGGYEAGYPRAEFRRRIEATGAVVGLESAWTRADGATVWVRESARLFRGRDGQPLFYDGTVEDVTERRRAEEALQASERRFRGLIEHGTDLTMILDADGRVTYLSPAVTRILGYTRSELEGKLVFDQLHPDDAELVRGALARALENDGAEIRLQVRVRRKDGTWRTLESVMTNLTGDPAVAGLVVNSRDVTEHAQAEETLRQEQFLVSTLMENIPDSIYFKDAGSRFIRVNRNLARVFGLSDPADAVGRTDFDFFLVEHAQAALETEREVIRTGKPVVNAEEMETWPDRPASWVSSTKMPLRDAAGTIVGTFGISRDITERKRAEEALRRSEADYRGLVEHATLGIYRATQDGQFLTVNPALVRMLGYGSVKALLRLNIRRDLYADPRERDHLLAQFEGGEEARNEAQWKRQDGSLVTVRINARLVRDSSGRIECLEGLVEDVTEQRSLENQFRQAQRLEAVGRLAGGVAHDFNNVLTAITGYSDLVLEELGPQDPKRADVLEIRAAAQRAAGLTRQLLAFSRKQVLQTRVLDLNDLVRTLQKMLQRLIGEDVKLEISLSPELGAVRADPGQIEQVVLNLAVNSRDAMPDGGRLTLETANAELGEDYVRAHTGAVAGRYVMLAVSDTGTGMDAETRSHIFEPFFTTKEQGKGTGLGLATVYGIVKQSGGYIWVYSEPGKGTAFKVYLPQVDAPVEEIMPPASPKPVPGGRETVLVAEDDAAVREIVSEVLAQKGYQVLRAPEGQTALELARAHPGEIHLLVTDLVMPGLTGRELAEAVRARHPGVRVLFMSGYTDDAVVRHGVLEEGLPYLQKPFTPDALATKVREVLGSPGRAASR